MSALGSWSWALSSLPGSQREDPPLPSPQDALRGKRQGVPCANGEWRVDDLTVESPEGGSIQAFLAQRVREGASASQIAEMIVSAWQHIHAALAPVIGQRGVAGLYKRSIHLTIPRYPWLTACSDGAPDTMDLSLLKTVLAHQAGSEAATGGGALLVALRELVGTLIGPKLTEQLLASVWVKFFSGTSAQDPPP
jgi:hypothetical protein